MKKFILSCFLWVLSFSVVADIVVIGNLNNDLPFLTKKQVQSIFMGRTRTMNGVRALPIDVVELRAEFYEKLTQRPIEQINAYWARLMFSGQSSPPKLMHNQQEVIHAVKEGGGVISYIDSKNVDKNQIKVLFVVK